MPCHDVLTCFWATFKGPVLSALPLFGIAMKLLRESDMQAPHHWTRPRKWQLTRPLALLLAAVFTDVVCEYKFCYTFIIFIRHRMADNNQSHLSHGFKNLLFLGYLPFRSYHLTSRFISHRKEEPLIVRIVVNVISILKAVYSEQPILSQRSMTCTGVYHAVRLTQSCQVAHVGFL